MAQTRSYDQYLTRVAGMIGIPLTGMTTDELGFLNAYFNNNVRNMWQLNNWLDVCPFGEARFVGNVLHYTNDIGQTTYWTATAGTVTRNSIANPLDGRITGCTLTETAATSQHSVAQPATFVGGATYQLSAYARPIGSRQLFIQANDGTTNYSAFFNLTTGVVGTQANLSQGGATMVQQANGFYLCTITFVANANAGLGTVSLLTSPDGIQTSFLGSISAGLYLWGNLLQQTTLVASNAYILPFEQEGESVIDAIFQIFRSSPSAPPYPRQVGYVFTPDGVQLIATTGWNTNYYGAPANFSPPITNPVFLYYRKNPIDYLGAAYSATLPYTLGSTILFTSPTTAVQNFYTAAITTSAGQSPENTPSNWTINTIYDVFFQYACYAGYADWLRQDGQFDKGAVQDQNAQKQMDDESDRMERQQGRVLPTNFSTHVTSQARY